MGRLTGITSVTAGRSLLRFFFGVRFPCHSSQEPRELDPGATYLLLVYLGSLCLEIGQGLCTGCCFPALLSRNLEFL